MCSCPTAQSTQVSALDDAHTGFLSPRGFGFLSLPPARSPFPFRDSLGSFTDCSLALTLWHPVSTRMVPDFAGFRRGHRFVCAPGACAPPLGFPPRSGRRTGAIPFVLVNNARRVRPGAHSNAPADPLNEFTKMATVATHWPSDHCSDHGPSIGMETPAHGRHPVTLSAPSG